MNNSKIEEIEIRDLLQLLHLLQKLNLNKSMYTKVRYFDPNSTILQLCIYLDFQYCAQHHKVLQQSRILHLHVFLPLYQIYIYQRPYINMSVFELIYLVGR